MKRTAIFEYIKKNIDNIWLLQETFSIKEIEENWQEELGNGILKFNHGTSKSKGVLIFIPKNLGIKVINTYHDNNGRLVILDCEFDGKIFTIINCYMPTCSNVQEQNEVLKTISDNLLNFSCNNIILEGI